MGVFLSDIKWSILINSVAAIVIVISFFYTEHLLFTRIILLLFVAGDVYMVLKRKQIKKSFFFVFSFVFLAGLVVAGVLDKTGVNLYLYIFGVVLLISSYRLLFNTNEENTAV